MPAVAITDSANMFGALEFATVAAEAGVQPIIGCQVNIRAEAREERPFGGGRRNRSCLAAA